MLCASHRRLLRPRGRLVFTSIAVATLFIANQSPASDSDRNSLVGTWRFTTFVDTPEGGQPVYAFGKNPIGFFVFTADGHVFLNIMRNPPNAALEGVDPDPDSCLPDWFCAYFGTYTLDRQKGTWVTHVLGSNMPNYHGTDQARPFTLHGDNLVISETYLAGGKRIQAERTLVREREAR
jgi:Lipocalin-like domain